MPLTSAQKQTALRKNRDADGLKEQRGVYVPKDWGKEHTAKMRGFVDKLIKGDT
jgi:hypothetical protein